MVPVSYPKRTPPKATKRPTKIALSEVLEHYVGDLFQVTILREGTSSGPRRGADAERHRFVYSNYCADGEARGSVLKYSFSESCGGQCSFIYAARLHPRLRLRLPRRKKRRVSSEDGDNHDGLNIATLQYCCVKAWPETAVKSGVGHQ